MRRRFTANKGFIPDNYLTIESLEDNLTVTFMNDIEYGIDGKEWIKLTAGTATESINTGQTLSFRGNLTPNSSDGIGTFTISKKCNLKGNCMSMLFGDNAANNYSLSGKNWAFCKLFYNCENIVNVDSNFLPATTLAEYCYDNMFQGCTNLTTAPELPATALAEGCYSMMFRACLSLTTAPELPATTLAINCYHTMFYACTNLVNAPQLPATTLASWCYFAMFEECYKLTTAPELPATTLVDKCYRYMFSGCLELTTAPELPATTLVDSCYSYMFYHCTKLNYIKMLATDISASNCLEEWVGNVSSTGTFIKNAAMESIPTGRSGIPNGWTVQNTQ